MCCFAQPVEFVGETKLFARLTDRNTQYLAYQMSYRSREPNAMILPLPVPPRPREDAVRFISLQDYESFFGDLQKGFPVVTPSQKALPSGDISRAVDSAANLEVHEVGDFVASFVPTQQDFGRLDPQFVISQEVWAQIPDYGDYGFAVFQLKELQGQTHPMAFEFETRWPDQVFFPTVHIHDGEVHEREHFDHSLFLQNPVFDKHVGNYVNFNALDRATGMVRSKWEASRFCMIEKAEGLVEPQQLVHRLDLRGVLENRDQIQAVATHRNGLPIQQGNSGGRLWPILPLLGGLAGLTWLFQRRHHLRQARTTETSADVSES